MSTSEILQLVTIILTLATTVITFIITSIINTKGRTVNTIANENLQKLNNFRDAFGTVLSMSNPEFIMKQCSYNQRIDMDYNMNYCFTIIKYQYLCKSQVYMRDYKEKKIFELLDNLVDASIDYYKKLDSSKKEDQTIKDIVTQFVKEQKALEQIREDFYIEVSIYNWALWKFVITQADGKHHLGKEFDKQYNEIMLNIKQNGVNALGPQGEVFNNIYKDYCKSVLKQNNIDLQNINFYNNEAEEENKEC